MEIILNDANASEILRKLIFVKMFIYNILIVKFEENGVEKDVKKGFDIRK